MAKIKFETGQVVNFDGDPTSKDIDEVANKLGIKKETPQQKQPGFVQSVVQGVTRPFLRLGLNAVNAVDVLRGKETKNEVDLGYFGKIKEIPGPFDKGASPLDAIGVGLEAGSNIIGGGGIKNIAQTGLKGLVKRSIKEGVTSGAPTGALLGAGEALQEGKGIGEATKEGSVGALGGLVFGTALGTLTPATRNLTVGGKNVAERVKASYIEPSDSILKKEQANLKEALEDAFSEKATLRKKNELFSRYGVEPSEVFARYGAVPKVVDGRMITDDIIDGFDQAIEKRVKARRPVLEDLSRRAPEYTSTQLDDFERKVLSEIANDKNAKKKGLVSQYQTVVRNRMNDFRKSYGETITLPSLDDIRSGQAGLTKSFRDNVYEADASEYIGRVARDLVEEKTGNTTLGAVNKEIRDLISAQEIARTMNNTPIKYGRFSQWMARLIGTAIGSQGIPVIGPLVGAIGGDAFIKLIQQNAFGGPLQRKILRQIGQDDAILKQLANELPETQRNILMKEVENAMRLPLLPAPKEGAAKVSSNVPIPLPSRTQSSVDMAERLNKDIKQPTGQLYKTPTKLGKTMDKIPENTNSLANEARKYKSAEEFYNTMPSTVRNSLRAQGIKGQEQVVKYWENATGQTSIKKYQMSHRPTETGATADDISKGGEVIPEDFYDHPEWYADINEKTYKESFETLKKIRGNPEAEITIYRASPKKELNKGDWVTLSKTYAKQESLAENTPVNSFQVKAKDIQFAGDDINEFGYYPKSQLTDIWNKTNRKLKK